MVHGGKSLMLPELNTFEYKPATTIANSAKMVYISADGTIGKKPLTFIQRFSRLKLQHKAIAFAILTIVVN
jgi:hypothetical protein